MATTTAKLGLTKPAYTEKADIAVINGNMDKIDTAMQKRDRVYNLLDNSDFRNPVNQRGQTRYTGAGYAIDRWRSWASSNTLTIHEGYYITTVGDYAQYIKGLPGDNYSAFAMRSDGTLIQLQTGYESANDWRFVSLPAGSYVWAALYPGKYTVETCPAYVPKGYAAELAECMRYQRIRGVGDFALVTLGAEKVFAVEHPGMRAVPAVEIVNPITGTAGTVSSYSNGGAFSAAVVAASQDRTIFKVGTGTSGNSYIYSYSISADL